jgi:hypothetical protein
LILKEFKSKHSAKEVEQVFDAYKGFFNNEDELTQKFRRSELQPGYFAFVGQENGEVNIYQYSEKLEKWVSGASVDKMAIHKFPDLTKDFHTFFEPSASGIYRCFGMEDNLPEGYNYGDNDFYVNVYAVSKNYKILDAIDIRSGRKFIKNMYNGIWKDWVETGGTGSVPMYPKQIFFTNQAMNGSKALIPLSELGIKKGDVISISCGEKGQAIHIDDVSLLEEYTASYNVSFENDELIYYIQATTNPICQMQIFKYVPFEVEPPTPWHPYLTLLGVNEQLSNNTKKGDRFDIDMKTTSWELVRKPIIEIKTRYRDDWMEVLFDGKERYYFEFPFAVNGDFEQGDTVEYWLVWQDQKGEQYTGKEKVTMDILV